MNLHLSYSSKGLFQFHRPASNGCTRNHSGQRHSPSTKLTVVSWHLVIVLASLLPNASLAQETSPTQSKVVVVTGARFSYPLLQQWIDDYNKVNPSAQIIIESRGSSDPAQYDILAEVFEPNLEAKATREYVYVARYAIFPVANSKSAFAKIYQDKGLSQHLISQLYFHDLYGDKQKDEEINVPYTVYTRLQRAGVPIVFTRYFGYEQKDIKGKAIAGADEHLMKALLRDTTALSYLPLALIYDHTSGNIQAGLTILPVDLNGNGRISSDEKFYNKLSEVEDKLEALKPENIHNIPINYLHLSVNKDGAAPQAIEFLRWIVAHGQEQLHQYGYLKPEPGRLNAQKFETD